MIDGITGGMMSAVTGGRRATWTLPLIAVVLLSGPARGAFEAELKTPAERAAATHMALGQIEGSLHLPLLDTAGRDLLPGITIYGFRPFGMDEIGALAGWGVLPLGGRGQGVCLAYQRFGGISYSEEILALRCCLGSREVRFRPGVRAGMVSFDGRLIGSALLIDLAIGIRLSRSIKVDLIAENPLGGIGSRNVRGPTCLSAGLGFLLASRLAWGVEVVKYAGRPTSVATGIEALLAKRVMVRSGFRSDPREASMGLGFTAGPISVDITSSLNLMLGLTHEVGITFIRRS
ncbi:MAG: hypothetical protein PVH52_06695 [bacterium]